MSQSSQPFPVSDKSIVVFAREGLLRDPPDTEHLVLGSNATGAEVTTDTDVNCLPLRCAE
jgi:hypothetical protein